MLVEATDSDFTALINGHPVGDLPPAPGLETTETLQMLAGVARSIRRDFRPAAWLVVEHATIVGLISIVAPPVAGAVAIGYGVAPADRGTGVMRRAIGDLLAVLSGNPRVTAVVADTSPDNLPSQRVLADNGFRPTGQRIDPEDGELIGWRFDLPAA